MSLASLRRYAEWYYTRYFPSRAILYEKLLKKAENLEQVENVMESIKDLFVEKNIIESHIRNYISQWKTRYFIEQKLRQKKFDKDLIQQVLWDFQETFHDPDTYKKTLENRVKKAIQKGMAYRKISYELARDFPEARALVQEMLWEYNDQYVLCTTVIPKLSRSHSWEDLVRKCLEKGFSLSDIRKSL